MAARDIVRRVMTFARVPTHRARFMLSTRGVTLRNMRRLVVLLLLVTLLVGCDAAQQTAPRSTQHDIVIVVLDTVRKDRLSTYGYERKTSPNLDRIARTSRNFDNAYATSGWTTPSHASLFSGLYPVAHGATQENWRLAENIESLAEVLGRAGYQTVGVAGNVMITAERGFAQGFETYHESWRGAKKHARDAITVDWVSRFLEERQDPRPLFLFINLIGAHGPFDSCGSSCGAFGARLDGQIANSFWRDFYLGRRRFTADQYDRLNRLYDAEIKEVDANLGKILRAFDARHGRETSFVAITSDHGENIGDHGHVNHVFSLYESTVQIPLLIRYPVALEGGSRDSRPAQLVDLYPTALAAAGLLDGQPETHGRNLLAADSEPRSVVTEYYRPDQAMLRLFPQGGGHDDPHIRKYWRRIRTVGRDGWKLIWGSDGNHELYHLANDPNEKHNLIDSPLASEMRDRLLGELETLIAHYGDGVGLLGNEAEASANQSGSGKNGTLDQESLDVETQEELRALGYIE